MANGPIQSIAPSSRFYQGPEDYADVLPFALDDVNIDYSRYSPYFKVYASDAINNMILNVLYTRIGERDFEPTFGSNALHFIHEPNDRIIPEVIEMELYYRIRMWVPYIDITISGILVQPVYDQQSFRIIFMYMERVSQIQRTFVHVFRRPYQELRRIT